MSNEEQPESREFMKIERLTPSSKEVLSSLEVKGFPMNSLISGASSAKMHFFSSPAINR